MRVLLQFIILFLSFSVTNTILGQNNSEKPNILWIVTEDNSKHYLDLYEEGGAVMPTIEALAKKGITFNHAFSNAPVCSVARSTIISGCYAPRTGAQYHRKMEKVPMPEGLKMFPYYLRQAGYYTTNNSKEDYNFSTSEETWDESSKQATYRNRKDGQPFFHVQNFGITHEGQLHFSKEKMDKNSTNAAVATIQPFPYHPNTPTFRYTYAWYQDLHQKADKAIQQFLQKLEADGLMDDTIIFYYGDHGGVLPRSKGYIYESGVHVPLVVYVPEKWQHLMPTKAGSRSDAFVQFIDLAPTVLHLAGVSVPKQMDGQPFLGKEISAADLAKRTTAFSYADRFDEKYDLVRAVRQGKYKYIRNYQPFNVDALFNFYRYKMLAFQEWATLYQAGKLNAEQAQFFQPRAVEALYDLEKDPHEVNNLAAMPAYQTKLKELRGLLQQQVKSMPDLSFYPEPYFLEKGLASPTQFGQQHQREIAQLVDIADLSLLPFDKAKKRIKRALKSSNPWERYWGTIVCSTFGTTAKKFYKKAKKISQADEEPLVKMRAIEFLALSGQTIDKAIVHDLVKNAPTETRANLLLNSVALIKTVRPDFDLELDKSLFPEAWVDKPGDLVNRRVDFINGE
ncbi:MAG: sulfatase [Bacteroidota bacterium]